MSVVGITGAAGHIGGVLARALAGKHELRLFDLRQPADGPEIRRLDCAVPEQVAGALDGLDALIHLAGDPLPNSPRSSTLRNNFRATSLVFEEARRAGVKRIVFASSNWAHQGAFTAILEGRRQNLITLDEPASPGCPYGESKVYGENLGYHLVQVTPGFTFVALRIGWTVPEDDPAAYPGDYMRAMFLSRRDLVQAVERALVVEAGFLAAFVISRNERRVFDLAETEERLGFRPADDAESYY